MLACSCQTAWGFLLMPQPTMRGRAPAPFSEGQFAAVWGDEIWVVRSSQLRVHEAQHTPESRVLHERNLCICGRHSLQKLSSKRASAASRAAGA